MPSLIDFYLLAANNRLEGITRGMRRRHGDIDLTQVFMGVALLAGIVLGIWLLSYCLSRKTERRGNWPLGLFLALAKAHGLTWSDTWRLFRHVRRLKLADPAALFLEPERFSPQALSPLPPLEAERLRALAGRLFSDLAEG